MKYRAANRRHRYRCRRYPTGNGQAALADPAITEHLGTIALDVFMTEPLPLDSALRDLPDHILTNHEISHTQENLGALFAMAVENIEAAIAGTPMPTAFPAPER